MATSENRESYSWIDLVTPTSQLKASGFCQENLLCLRTIPKSVDFINRKASHPQAVKPVVLVGGFRLASTTTRISYLKPKSKYGNLNFIIEENVISWLT